MLIDEKGRLFGLINLLDLIVLAVLLILIYLGISSYIALKVGVPKLLDFSPKEIYSDKGGALVINLRNERFISSAYVRLIPQNFTGETKQFQTFPDKREKEKIIVPIPPGLTPGKYTVEVQIGTLDVFRRQSIYETGLSETFLTVTQERPVVKIMPYPWAVDVDVFFPSVREAGAVRVRAGDEFSDSSGQIITQAMTVRESESEDTLSLSRLPFWKGAVPYLGGQTVRLRANLQKIDQNIVLQYSELKTGSPLKLRIKNREKTGYILGRVAIEPPKKYQEREMGVMLLGLERSQMGLITPGAAEVDDSGRVMAQVIQVFDESQLLMNNTPYTPVWPPLSNRDLVNLTVRMRLLCEPREDKLFYRNVAIEPRKLVTFVLNGQKVAGSILREDERFNPLTFNVFFPIVPESALPEIQEGMYVYGGNNAVVARIVRLLSVNENPCPFGLEELEPAARGRKYFQVLARMDLQCTLINGMLAFLSEIVRYGKEYNFRFPVADLKGIIWYNDKAPAPRQIEWVEVVIEFRAVLKNQVALLKDGIKEEQEGRPVTITIEEIISNKESTWVPQSAWVPGKRDVLCRVKMKVQRSGERLYYQGIPLYIERTLNFTTNDLNMNFNVISFGSRIPGGNN